MRGLLSELLKQRIAREGPMTVADYMRSANAAYYGTRDPLGQAGDFITAPEISQLFGEMIGAWLASTWQAMGAPSPVMLLELGPGRGTLMADLWRATRRVPGFHQAMRVYFLETSPVLRAIQQRAVPHAQPIDTLDALPEGPLLAVANEFFDALPIRQFAGAQERKVELRGGHLCFTLPAENIRETCEEGVAVMRILARRIAQHGGAALAIDYGYAEGSGDTLQAVKGHAYADPLAAPGEADITAHVDFAALAEAARAEGAVSFGPVGQGIFLRRLGIELRATALCRDAVAQEREALLSGCERLVAPRQMGELFKVMAIINKNQANPEGF